MTGKRTVEIAGFFLVLAGLCLALYEYHGQAVARARLEATEASEKAAQAQIAKQSDAVTEDLNQRIAALESAKAEAQTPSQIIKQIPVYLPENLPAPITPIVQAPPPAAKDQTPEVTGATVPAADFKPIFDQLVECKECSAKLAACTTQASLDQQQLASVTRELNEANKAVKGGSFLTRMKHDAKTIFISAAVGFAIRAAVKK